VTAAVHLTVLIGLLVFVVHQVMRTATLDRRRALVTVVAPNMKQVTSPVRGVFTASRYLPKGTLVQAGTELGRIESPEHEANVQRARTRLACQLRQRNHLSTEFRRSADYAVAMGAIVDQIEATRVELDILARTTERLCVRAPISGYIEHGLSGSFSVEPQGAIVHLYQQGDELLVEVRGPLDLVHQLVRQEKFQTEFSTVGGKQRASVVPIPSSLKTVHRETSAKRDELWGAVQCIPCSLPAAVAVPGTMGRL
jgi:multidrug resistance efflux pump